MTRALNHVLHECYFIFNCFFIFTYDFFNYDFVNLFFRPQPKQYVCTLKLDFPKLTLSDFLVINIISILIIYLLYIVLLYYSNMFRYISFSSNISTLNKKSLLQIQISQTLVIQILYFIVLIKNIETFLLLILTMFEIDIFHVKIILYCIYVIN